MVMFVRVPVLVRVLAVLVVMVVAMAMMLGGAARLVVPVLVAMAVMAFGRLALAGVMRMHVQMPGGLLGGELLVRLGLLLLFGHVAGGLVGARDDRAGAGVRLDDQESVEPAFDDVRFVSDLLRVFHRRVVVRHQHAVVLDFQAQVAVAQLEAQAAHLLHGAHGDLDELRGFDAGEIPLVLGFGEHVAVLDGPAHHDAEFGAVLGHLPHALLVRLEPFEGDRHVQFAVAVLLADDVAGYFLGDHPSSFVAIVPDGLPRPAGVRNPRAPGMPPFCRLPRSEWDALGHECRSGIGSLCNERVPMAAKTGEKPANKSFHMLECPVSRFGVS